MKRITDEIIPGSDVRGIVIYGSGRHFSSGADLGALIDAVKTGQSAASGHSSGPGLLNENLNSFEFFEQCAVPVVAAIRGVCLGSAFELALFCHARVCGEGSVLGLPESTFGLMPGCGGINKMHALAGRARTLELVCSGASFGPEEALEWNLVDIIVPRKEVITAAIELIGKISGRRRSGHQSIIVEDTSS